MSTAVATLQGALLHAEHVPARRPVVPIYHGMQHRQMHLKLRLGDKSIRMDRKFFRVQHSRLHLAVFGCTDAIFLNGYAR